MFYFMSFVHNVLAFSVSWLPHADETLLNLTLELCPTPFETKNISLLSMFFFTRIMYTSSNGIMNVYV